MVNTSKIANKLANMVSQKIRYLVRPPTVSL